MENLVLDDTIAAIATPLGESGIGIVRLSGKGALSVAGKVFVSKDGSNPGTFRAYTTHYGWITPDKTKGKIPPDEIIDEVILTVMLHPRSYTREDVVEINCHGGIVAVRAVLELVLANGCRLAEPGEFTRRAFMNGRIDLAQAEAVLDMIRAKTDAALRVGAEQLKGGLSQRIDKLRGLLLDAAALIEANIDFPEEEIGSIDLKGISVSLSSIDNQLKSILEGARRGQILREGVHAVICGRPNVGKSSLLNALLKKERSIVSSVAGTTRDTIEEIIDIKGIPVRIVDTAGIIEPRDLVEKKAVERSKRYIKEADLVILIFDGSHRLTAEDKALVKRLKDKMTIAVINKIDLKQKIEKAGIAAKFSQVVELSAKKIRNIEFLEDAIAKLVFQGKVALAEPALVSNLRHISALRQAKKLIEEALNSLDNKVSLELVAEDIKGAISCFDALLGKSFSEDLLDRIFSDFCIGK